MKIWLPLCVVLTVSILLNLSASNSYALTQPDSSEVLLVAYPANTVQLQDYVKTDKSYYVLGPEESAIIQISGHVSGMQPSVTITIKTPNNTQKSLTWNIDPAGYFTMPYLIYLNAPSGAYQITVNYNGGQVSVIFYVIRS